MKKLSLILLAIMLMFTLTACAGGNATDAGNAGAGLGATSAQAPTSTPATTQTPDDEVVPASDASAETVEPTETEEAKTLVAYFSWSGNTRQMAQIIAQQTGADLFEISTVTPYTDDYDELLDIAQQEQGENARPELDAQVEDWDNYDTIFVGYPNWWSDAPMAVYTFVESYDFSGKTLIPFNTSASGGFGRSVDGITQSAAGATVLEGLDLTEGELGNAENRVATWLDSLGLNG